MATYIAYRNPDNTLGVFKTPTDWTKEIIAEVLDTELHTQFGFVRFLYETDADGAWHVAKIVAKELWGDNVVDQDGFGVITQDPSWLEELERQIAEERAWDE